MALNHGNNVLHQQIALHLHDGGWIGSDEQHHKVIARFRTRLTIFFVKVGVVKRHFNGGASDQTNVTVNGFNMSDPVTGLFEARLSIESVRSLDLESAAPCLLVIDCEGAPER